MFTKARFVDCKIVIERQKHRGNDALGNIACVPLHVRILSISLLPTNLTSGAQRLADIVCRTPASSKRSSKCERTLAISAGAAILRDRHSLEVRQDRREGPPGTLNVGRSRGVFL